MKLIAILNCDANWGIGKKNGLLFRLSLDMKFFKQTTLGHTVAMGENTLLSFPHAAPLQGRTNIVLSSDPTHDYPNVINAHSMDDFHAKIKEALQKDDVFVIGGASIYAQMLPFCDEVLLTKVAEDGGAEVFFPNLDENRKWKKEKESAPVLDNGHVIAFLTYVNLDKQPL